MYTTPCTTTYSPIHATPPATSSSEIFTTPHQSSINWSQGQIHSTYFHAQSPEAKLAAACRTLDVLYKKLEQLKLEAGQPSKKARLEPTLRFEQNVKVTSFDSDDFAQRINSIENEIHSLKSYIGQINIMHAGKTISNVMSTVKDVINNIHV